MEHLLGALCNDRKSSGNWGVMIVKIHYRRPLPTTLPLLLLAGASVFIPAMPGDAQAQTAAPATMAALHEPAANESEHDGGKTAAPAPAAPAATPDPEISPAVAKQLAAMQAEIEELRAELKGRTATAVSLPEVRATEPAVQPEAKSAVVPAAEAPAPAPPVSVAQQATDTRPSQRSQNPPLHSPTPTGPG